MQEAEAYGSCIVSEHQTESTYNELAPKYSIVESLKSIFHGRWKFHGEWEEAVLARSSILSRLILHQFYRARTVRLKFGFLK